jgi:hypothetical protein
MSYAGIVIGGPWAGKHYEARHSRVDVVTGPYTIKVPRGNAWEAQTVEAQREIYVYTELFGVSMWVPKGWSQDDIAKEVFMNYRPAAVKDVAAKAW